MILKIKTPDAILFDEETTHIKITEKTGGFSILNGHAPLITIVKNFVTTITTKAGDLTFIGANFGTLKILDNEISIFIDYGVIATSKEEAKEKLTQKRQQLINHTGDPGDETIAHLELELLRRMKELGET